MPNRILKDSICTSPNIARLSRDAEVFFYRLIVQCDDFGRLDARLPILRAKCYPLQLDQVTEPSIGAWLTELVRAELVILYSVDGQEYLHMTTWERHQQVRAKRSKYPQPISPDIKRYQVQSNVTVIQSNPIQSESESESESESNAVSESNPPPDGEKPLTDGRTDTDLTKAIVAKMEMVGIGVSQYTVDTYVAAAQEHGIHAVLAGITSAAEQGKQHKMSYVLACIRNKVSGNSDGRSVPPPNGNRPMSKVELTMQAFENVQRRIAAGETL